MDRNDPMDRIDPSRSALLIFRRLVFIPRVVMDHLILVLVVENEVSVAAIVHDKRTGCRLEQDGCPLCTPTTRLLLCPTVLGHPPRPPLVATALRSATARLHPVPPRSPAGNPAGLTHCRAHGYYRN